jgi:hypothetical protein
MHPATKTAGSASRRPAPSAPQQPRDDGSPIDLRFDPTEMLRVLARSMLAMNARLARNLFQRHKLCGNPAGCYGLWLAQCTNRALVHDQAANSVLPPTARHVCPPRDAQQMG